MFPWLTQLIIEAVSVGRDRGGECEGSGMRAVQSQPDVGGQTGCPVRAAPH